VRPPIPSILLSPLSFPSGVDLLFPLRESRTQVKSGLLCSPPLHTSPQSPDGRNSSGGGKLRAVRVWRGGNGRGGGQRKRKAASSLVPLPSSSPSLLPSSWPAPLISSSALDSVFRFQILSVVLPLVLLKSCLLLEFLSVQDPSAVLLLVVRI